MTVTASDTDRMIDIPSPTSDEGVPIPESAEPTCTGARARASAYPTRWGRGALHALMVTVGDYRQVWETPPPPTGEVWGWARAGTWTGHRFPVLRGTYAAYAAVVAMPTTALAYWATGALMQVSGLDDPEDPQENGWTPTTPPPFGELASRWRSDLATANGRRGTAWVVFVEGAAGVASGVALGVAWLFQRLGRAGTTMAIAAACWWG